MEGKARVGSQSKIPGLFHYLGFSRIIFRPFLVSSLSRMKRKKVPLIEVRFTSPIRTGCYFNCLFGLFQASCSSYGSFGRSCRFVYVIKTGPKKVRSGWEISCSNENFSFSRACFGNQLKETVYSNQSHCFALFGLKSDIEI